VIKLQPKTDFISILKSENSLGEIKPEDNNNSASTFLEIQTLSRPSDPYKQRRESPTKEKSKSGSFNNGRPI